MLNEKDFVIQTLGKATVTSPFGYSSTRGDGIVNYVDDALRVPYCITNPCEAGTEGLFFEYAGPRKNIYFNPHEVTAAIMTCGGLCPGLNNAIRSMVMQLFYKYQVKNIFGIQYGQKGLDPSFGHDLIPLTPQIVAKIQEIGGSFLGTSRGKVPVDTIITTLKKHKINVLLCLGGDGTQKGLHEIFMAAEKQNMKLAAIGIPKTIDNDISYVEKTFGLDTAVTIAKEAVRSAHCEAESAYNGIGLVKVMGRASGYIAALTTLANSDVNFCLIPEVPFDLNGAGGLLEVLEERLLRRHHAVIVIAEGAGQELFGSDHSMQTYDASGNVRYNDVGLLLKNRILEHFRGKKIPIDLKYIDPSYMIRSVPTNANDSIFAAELGRMSVDAALAGKTDMLIGYWHNVYTHVPLALATSKRKKINSEGELWREVLSTTGQPMNLRARA